MQNASIVLVVSEPHPKETHIAFNILEKVHYIMLLWFCRKKLNSILLASSQASLYAAPVKCNQGTQTQDISQRAWLELKWGCRRLHYGRRSIERIFTAEQTAVCLLSRCALQHSLWDSAFKICLKGQIWITGFILAILNEGKMYVNIHKQTYLLKLYFTNTSHHVLKIVMQWSEFPWHVLTAMIASACLSSPCQLIKK